MTDPRVQDLVVSLHEASSRLSVIYLWVHFLLRKRMSCVIRKYVWGLNDSVSFLDFFWADVAC